MPETAKTERLEARVPVTLKRVIQRAAELQGRSLTDFIIGSLEKTAREVVRDHEVLKLGAEESIRVAKALLNPPAPNAALKRAAERHRKMVRMA